MGPRFLLANTDVPALGGASTALYDLYRRLQRDGHDVRLLNMLEEQDSAFFHHTFGERLGNPGGLAGVDTCWLTDDLGAPQPEVTRCVESVRADVLVGFGYLAALLLKRAVPSCPTVLVTGSCQQAQEWVTSGGARDAMDLTRRLARRGAPPRILHGGEQAAVEASDLVITHSPQTSWFMERFFPRSVGKIHPEVISFAEWICDGAMPAREHVRPFEQRDIGVLFVASDWGRPVKNYPLVRAIARRLGAGVAHVVGDVPRPISGAVHHGFLPSREALLALSGRARCVACPSLIDAAPGVLFEAATLGCNVVASRNCGNWELCHPDLLAATCGARDFAAAIGRALARKYDDALPTFLAVRGYANLTELLNAFARPFRSRAAG